MQETIEEVLSNMNGVGGDVLLNNLTLIDTLVQEIDPSRFNVEVLDEVFSCFITSLGETPSYNLNNFEHMKNGEKLRQPVLFTYKNNFWKGKIIWKKWCNNADAGKVWNSFSIKLPNNDYLYNKSHQDKDPVTKVSYIKEGSIPKLAQVIEFAINFFDDEEASLLVFYYTERSRLNIQVKSEKYKALLQVTFEYGYPEQSPSDSKSWYTKKQMLELLENKK